MKLNQLLLFLVAASFTNLALAGGGSYDALNTPAAAAPTAVSTNTIAPQNIKLSDNFSGFAFEVFAGTQNTKSESDKSIHQSGVLQSRFNMLSTDDTDGVYGFGLSYNFPINDRFLIGLGFDYYLDDIEMGTSNLVDVIASETGNWNTYELEDVYSIYLKPQYAISEDKLTYIKIAYVASDISMTNQDIEFVSISDEDMNGFSVGIGYKQLFSKSFYAFAEANYIKFEDESLSGNFIDMDNANAPYTIDHDIDADAFNFKVGIGYQF